MNVAFDPWIPLVTMEGKRKLASLAEVFTDGERYADLAVRPHERVSLMRLFLCVAHAALNGPKNYEEWCEVPKRLPGEAQKYLTKWKDSFELFHPEKPWLQVAGLDFLSVDKNADPDDTNGWATLNKISFTKVSGNNPALFDHDSSDQHYIEFDPEEIALNLLTFQNFFVAGGKASSRVWGKFEMNNPPNPKGGPCAGKSILFTFVRGKHLAESLHLNLNSIENLKLIYGGGKDWLGAPLWEIPIKNPADTDAIKNATQTHLGRLVPLTRLLRINHDRKRILLGAGFLYPKFQDESNPFHPDPFATVVVNSSGERELVSARPNVGVWRQLHSLMVRRADASSGCRGPICLLNTSPDSSFDVVVSSMLTNPKQAAEILDLLESVFHIPSQLFMPEGTISYEQGVKEAVSVSSRLGTAVSEYRKELDDKWLKTIKDFEKKTAKKSELEKARGKKFLESTSPLYAKASNHYWTTVEKNLPLLMAHIEAIDSDDANPTRDAWRKMLFVTALDAYTVACGQETPRQMRAFAKGMLVLSLKKKEDETDINEQEEDDA